MPVLTRDTERTNTKFIVRDASGTYRAYTFKEAQRVLKQCHIDKINVSTFIALYCEA